MSWAAHEFEPYTLQRHLGGRVSFLALALGSFGPDMFTKWYVYGLDTGVGRVGAANPAQFHRGWPGAGFTHTLAFALAAGALVWLVTRSRGWGLGYGIGACAHVISDIGDSVGIMLLFPFSTRHFSLDLWAYAAEAGRHLDAAAYYSSLGAVMDGTWLVIGLANWRVFRADYFRTVIAPADGAWAWLGRWLPEEALLAVYRAFFFYGAARFTYWLIWAHVLNHYEWDLSLGGPHWIEAVRL